MERSGSWVYPRGLIEPPIPAVAAAPLRLYERGVWNPAEHYWGEVDGMIAVPLIEVIVGGARLEFEFEQLLPGGDNPDADDPVLDALELRSRGDTAARSAHSRSWSGGIRAAWMRTPTSACSRSRAMTRAWHWRITLPACRSPSSR